MIWCFVLSTQHCKHVLSPPSFLVGDHTPQNNDKYVKMYWRRCIEKVVVFFVGTGGHCHVVRFPKEQTNKQFPKMSQKCFQQLFFFQKQKNKQLIYGTTVCGNPTISSPTDSQGHQNHWIFTTEVDGWEQVFTEQSTTGNSSTGPRFFEKSPGAVRNGITPQELGICGFPRGICVADFVLW